jgi:hypothetical protein
VAAETPASRATSWIVTEDERRVIVCINATAYRNRLHFPTVLPDYQVIIVIKITNKEKMEVTEMGLTNNPGEQHKIF